MLRWTEGAKPGKVVKRKRTADDVIEQKRSYEGHRNRGFQGHWKNGRTWLTFENEKMFCTYCRDANKTNKFVVGSTNFRLEAIVAHEVFLVKLKNFLKDYEE